MIVFLALFFTFGVPSAIAFLIYYFKHVRKPLELAKIGKCDDYTELKKILKEKVIVTKIVNAKIDCKSILAAMKSDTVVKIAAIT